MKRRNGPWASEVENIELVLWATQPSQNSIPSLRARSLARSPVMPSAPPGLKPAMLKKRLSSKKLSRRSGLAVPRSRAAGRRSCR